MAVLGYLETLNRFGLQELRQGDLQLRDGNIAITADGDFQFGDIRTNALFRLVERWRVNQPTLDALYASALTTSQHLNEVLHARAQGRGASLVRNPAQFHEENESIDDYESGSSVFAGALLLVMNNMLQRLRLDLGASDSQWNRANPKVCGHSVGALVTAAAANFRHHDEWARSRALTERQYSSMAPLCGILGRALPTGGQPAIRTNVCREVLMIMSGESPERLHQLIFEFAKALAA